MGVLDEAIREHLELKRRRGATDEEIERAEAEALGPARREAVAEAPVPDEATELFDQGGAPPADAPPPPPPDALLPNAATPPPPPPRTEGEMLTGDVRRGSPEPPAELHAAPPAPDEPPTADAPTELHPPPSPEDTQLMDAADLPQPGEHGGPHSPQTSHDPPPPAPGRPTPFDFDH